MNSTIILEKGPHVAKAKKRKGWLREEPETLQQKIGKLCFNQVVIYRLVVHQSLICCNFKEEDEKFDKSVPEVNGGDYNEDGREGLTCSSLMQRFVSSNLLGDKF